METKKGVNLIGLHPKMQIANAIASVIWNEEGQTLVITSAVDGKHRLGSMHYVGRGCDYRTRYFDPFTKDVVANALQEALSDDYDVVVEIDHIHVEYDPVNPKII